MDPTTKMVVDIIAQVGFPIVLILALIYYVGKHGLPKVATMIEKIVDDFREEMRLERENHNRQIERYFAVEGNHHTATITCIDRNGDRVVEAVKEHCKKGATG